jgi:competence protein ComEC
LENILKVGFAILEGINTILGSISINIIIGKVSLAFLTFYYIFVFLGHKKKRYYLLIVLLLLVAKFKVYLDSNNYVYYLDVGQGDATFIVSEHRKDIILIDSGGKMEYQKESWQVRNSTFNLADTLAQFMKSLGISKIDLFIATHGDKDHIGYAIDLFKEIKVDKIMVNNNKLNNDEKKLLNMGDEQIKNTFKGKNIYIKNLNNVVDSDENDSSLVLHIIIGNMNLLIMGDAPKIVEQDVIKRYNYLKIDVLKVGHHGSNTSSDYLFLKELKPKMAIISAGRNNRYNHPSIETIETLDKLRIKYYNTQNSGTIIFQFNERLNNLTFCKP